MYYHEKEVLINITNKLKEEYRDIIVAIYAFGSRVRGDFDEWSDFDILVVIKNKDSEIEKKIIGIFIDEEMKSGVSFTPVIKDIRSFDLEKKYNSPFYQNVSTEGILL